ncbi:hypothetical protein [Gimesia maris]|uniref:hypothetical protein n=1 Tax=Gimesia maris TaxID=122 RepID=UPI0012B6D300|nr:hypothetical protein [Gimesia maris]
MPIHANISFLRMSVFCGLLALLCTVSACDKLESPIKRKVYPESNLNLRELIHDAVEKDPAALEELGYEFSQGGCPVGYLIELARISQDKTVPAAERRLALDYLASSFERLRFQNLQWDCIGQLEELSQILAPGKVLPENRDLLDQVWVKLHTREAWAAYIEKSAEEQDEMQEEAMEGSEHVVTLLGDVRWTQGNYDLAPVSQMTPDQLKHSINPFQFEVRSEFLSQALLRTLVTACRNETVKDRKLFLLGGLAATRTDIAYQELRYYRAETDDPEIIDWIDSLYNDYYLHQGLVFGISIRFLDKFMTFENVTPEQQAPICKIYANYFQETVPTDPVEFEIWWSKKWGQIDIAAFTAATIELAARDEDTFATISELMLNNNHFFNQPAVTEAYLKLYESENIYARVSAARILCQLGDFRGVPFLIDVACDQIDQPVNLYTPHARGRALYTLIELAGDNYFRNHTRWTRWWNENQAAARAAHQPGWYQPR